MASPKIFASLKHVGAKPRILFSRSNTSVPLKIFAAGITGRASRVEKEDKPAPWPYETRGYRNWHAFFDYTRKRMGENSKLIVVEGPPGIGKSELARSLAEELEMRYYPMVTSEHYFINSYGGDERSIDPQLPPRMRSFDEKGFFKDPYSEKVVRLQMHIWWRKFKQYADALAHILNTGQGVVLDRCVFSEQVFADTLVDVGYMKRHENAGLNKIKAKANKEANLMKPHLVIYLDAPPAVVEANLKKRGLGEEKVFTREVLERLEHNYKYTYLKTISEHAELLAYDWSTPGDGEVVVEDIERIDFDRFDIYDPKMKDWRLQEEWDWNERRWDFTTSIYEAMGKAQLVHTPDVPALELEGHEVEIRLPIIEKVPGHKYRTGFNPQDGDDNLWFKWPRMVPDKWPDYDPKVRGQAQAK